MGGKPGKKQLPDVDQQLNVPTTEMEDPTGDKAVSKAGPGTLQGEGGHQVSRVLAEADKPKGGDAVLCAGGGKEAADSPIKGTVETDQPGDMPLAVAVTAPVAGSEVDVAKPLTIIPEEIIEEVQQ